MFSGLTAREINKYAVECGLYRRLHMHKYSSLLWPSKELKVMFLKPVRGSACEFLLKKPRLKAFAHLVVLNCWKNCRKHLLHFSFISSLCGSVLSYGKYSQWWMRWWVTNVQKKKVVFQKFWLHFNSNLHGDICFYPFFARQRFTAIFCIWKKQNKNHPPPSLHSAPR